MDLSKRGTHSLVKQAPNLKLKSIVAATATAALANSKQTSGSCPKTVDATVAVAT